jgi:phage terminase small subunit
MTLSAKHARFVADYLVDLNATRAYRAVYGVSQKVAEASGSRLLRNVRVRQVIAEAQTARLERLKIDADEAMRLNAEIGRFDPIALQDEAGNYRPLKDIPAEARRCIRRIRVHKLNLTTGDGQTDRVVDYEFYDKYPAIDRDYKRNGLLRERVDLHQHGPTLEELICGVSNSDGKQ